MVDWLNWLSDGSKASDEASNEASTGESIGESNGASIGYQSLIDEFDECMNFMN